MIIQCEQCKTKFRLDDSKVSSKGVKVRCAKCRTVFSVAPPEQPDDLLESSAAATGGDVQQPESPAVPAPASENWDELFAAAAAQQESEMAAVPAGADAFAAAADEKPAPVSAPEEPADLGPSFAFDDTAAAGPATTFEEPPEEASQATAADFNPFAVDEDPFAAAPTAAPAAVQEEPAAGAQESSSFSFDAADAFADAFKPASEAPAPEAPPAQPESTEFSFEAEDAFADAFKPAAEASATEEPPAAPDSSEFSFSFDEGTPSGTPVPAVPAEETGPDASGGMDFGAFEPDQKAAPEGQIASEPLAQDAFSFGDDNPFAEVATPAVPAEAGPEGAGTPETTGEDEFSFGDPFAVPSETAAETQSSGAGPEGADVPFEDPFAAPAGAGPEAPSFAVDADKAPDLAFGDENPFADIPLSSTAVSGEPADQGINFDTLDFSAGKEEAAPAFGAVEDVQAPEDAGPSSAPAAPGEEAAESDDFFDALKSIAPPGREAAAGPAPEAPPAGAPPEALVAAAVAEAVAQPQPAPEPAPLDQAPPPQEELPPLSIASRRKGSPLLKILLAVLGVVVAAVVGFFAWMQLGEDKAKPVQEAERISIRGVNASFVKNPGGELLVISGEAVNNYKKPRAAIQVKGMVFGPGGQVLKSKNAYAGNPLTKEQVASMSLDKIEAAMANQFGDSLSNLEVAPGKAIPFVIVVPQPPAEAKDYGVEAAGSTVATGKQ